MTGFLFFQSRKIYGPSVSLMVYDIIGGDLLRITRMVEIRLYSQKPSERIDVE